MNDIVEKIKKCNNIVLLCHKNPDGDAIGSCIAMYHTLKLLDKDVDMVISEAPIRFSYLKGYDDILKSSCKEYDTAIVLDTATVDRVDDPDGILKSVNRIFVIDHHISNTNYGDVNCVFKYPACCELVYYVIKELLPSINYDIAEALCTGLLTDTGNFSHSDVLPSTFVMASVLSEFVNIADINKKVFNININIFMIKKFFMEHLEFYNDGKLAYSYITEDDMKEALVDHNDCSVLASMPLEIDGVEVSIFVRKLSDKCRVSLRSVNVDVNEIMSVFGGGGHVNAAGGFVDIPYDELKEMLLNEVGNKVNEWYSCN